MSSHAGCVLRWPLAGALLLACQVATGQENQTGVEEHVAHLKEGESLRIIVEREGQQLVLQVANEKGAGGGLTLNVKLSGQPAGQVGDDIGQQPAKLYRVRVEDAQEAALIQQQLKVEPVRLRDHWFYFRGNDRLSARLRELAYEAEEVDPMETLEQYVRLEGVEGEEGKRTMAEVGVRVMIREPKYWIVRATPQQLALLKRLKYRVGDLGPEGPRPRQVRVLVDKLEETAKVAPLLADLFSEEPAGKRFALHGAAWDDMIDELKARGYTVEPVKNYKE